MARPGEPAPGFFAAYRAWATVPPPTWADIAWLRDQWAGPFLVKGVMRPDDARRAVDAGATAVSVSNHGGNNLDGTPASIRALPAVAAAVAEQRRGAARRRHPARRRRGEGPRPRRPRGHDRPRLPVGPGGGGPAGVGNVFDVLRSALTRPCLPLAVLQFTSCAGGRDRPRGFTQGLKRLLARTGISPAV